MIATTMHTLAIAENYAARLRSDLEAARAAQADARARGAVDELRTAHEAVAYYEREVKRADELVTALRPAAEELAEATREHTIATVAARAAADIHARGSLDRKAALRARDDADATASALRVASGRLEDARMTWDARAADVVSLPSHHYALGREAVHLATKIAEALASSTPSIVVEEGGRRVFGDVESMARSAGKEVSLEAAPHVWLAEQKEIQRAPAERREELRAIFDVRRRTTDEAVAYLRDRKEYELFKAQRTNELLEGPAKEAA